MEAPDEDDDNISDEDEGRDENVDTDADGTPDYLDDDSDNDTISDDDEGGGDRDGDGIANFRDTDADADCRSDAIEAGDAELATPPQDTDGDGFANAYDFDSDGDGLSDQDEDTSCDGVADPGETSATSSDTDADGASDLIELEGNTDPNDASDNPLAQGNFVFEVPFELPPSPTQEDLDFSTQIKKLDIYVLMDLSGSMGPEIAAVRTGIDTALTNVSCQAGVEDPSCIPDIWSGVGTIGYRFAEGRPFTHLSDVQPDTGVIGELLSVEENVDEPSCDNSPDVDTCREVTYLAIWSALTGNGSEAAGGPYSCEITDDYAGRDSCAVAVPVPTEPMNPPEDRTGRYGYPCFRPDSLPVILWATDESTQASVYTCPDDQILVDTANAMGAKLVGVTGDDGGSNLVNEMKDIARRTGAVDITRPEEDNALFFRLTGTEGAEELETGIRALANGLPLDITAEAIDDPADNVDAVAAFIERLETQQLGTAECASGLEEVDSNNDDFADKYLGVQPRTPVCWKLVPKMNTTVEPSDTARFFKATIKVSAGATQLDEREVLFVVPPVILVP